MNTSAIVDGNWIHDPPKRRLGRLAERTPSPSGWNVARPWHVDSGWRSTESCPDTMDMSVAKGGTGSSLTRFPEKGQKEAAAPLMDQAMDHGRMQSKLGRKCNYFRNADTLDGQQLSVNALPHMSELSVLRRWYRRMSRCRAGRGTRYVAAELGARRRAEAYPGDTRRGVGDSSPSPPRVIMAKHRCLGLIWPSGLSSHKQR